MNIFKLSFLVFAILSFLILKQDASASSDRENQRDPVEMIQIPAGEFLMGSKQEKGRRDEKPQRIIFLDTYEIDAYEVSNERYLNFINKTQRKEPPNPYSKGLLSELTGIGNLPVVQVTWYDAVDYCRWTGKQLPTEAQWEKSARGEKGLVFPWGNTSPSTEKINFQKNWEGTKTLWPVNKDLNSSSSYGLKGMAGNVREWVQDWYAPDYFENSPKKNPTGPEQGILKVIKGGSWHSFKADVRSASRGKGGFALKTDGIGFRCARTMKLKN